MKIIKRNWSQRSLKGIIKGNTTLSINKAEITFSDHKIPKMAQIKIKIVSNVTVRSKFIIIFLIVSK